MPASVTLPGYTTVEDPITKKKIGVKCILCLKILSNCAKVRQKNHLIICERQHSKQSEVANVSIVDVSDDQMSTISLGSVNNAKKPEILNCEILPTTSSSTSKRLRFSTGESSVPKRNCAGAVTIDNYLPVYTDQEIKSISASLAKSLIIEHVPFTFACSPSFEKFTSSLSRSAYKSPNLKELTEAAKQVYHGEVKKQRENPLSFGTLLIVRVQKSGFITHFVSFIIVSLSTDRCFFLDVHETFDQAQSHDLWKFMEDQKKLSLSLYNVDVNRVICNEDFTVECESLGLVITKSFNQFFIEKTGKLVETFGNFSYTSFLHIIDSWADNIFSNTDNRLASTSDAIQKVLRYFNHPRHASALRERGVELKFADENSMIEKSVEFDCFLMNIKKLKQIYADSDSDDIDGIHSLLYHKSIIDDATNHFSTLSKFKKLRDLIVVNTSVADIVEQFFELEINEIVSQEQQSQLLTDHILISYMLHPQYKANRLSSQELAPLRQKLIKPLSKGQNELRILSDFLKGEGYFNNQDLKDLQFNPIDFWTTCDSYCPLLSKLALQQSILPSSISLSDVAEAKKAVNFITNSTLNIGTLDPIIYFQISYLLLNP